MKTESPSETLQRIARELRADFRAPADFRAHLRTAANAASDALDEAAASGRGYARAAKHARFIRGLE